MKSTPTLSPITSFVRFAAVVLLIGALQSCGGSDQATKPNTNSSDERFAQGKKAFDEGHWLDAIRIFEEVRVQAPTSEVATEATYLEAMARFKQEMYSGAAVDFRALRRNYPSSPLAARAQYMVGESYFQLNPKPQLDQSFSVLSLGEFQAFIREFPNAPQTLIDSAQQRIQSIRDRLAEKAFLSADLYVKLEDPKSAIVYYNRVLENFYDTRFAPESQLRIAEIQYDRGKVDEARTALSSFEDKYLKVATEDLRQRALKLRSRLPQG